MILAVLQARVSSTRLPGKVLKPILGKPMLARQLERIQRARRLSSVVVATSLDPSDEPLVGLCAEAGVRCYRGSLNDVLDRMYQAAQGFGCSHIVRLNGDCPLIDPGLIDLACQFHLEGGFDYTSNQTRPTYPDGLDVEVARMESLEQAWKEAVLPSEREHVMPFLYKHPERFKLGSIEGDIDLSRLRWTVDHQDDFDLVSAIYAALYPMKPAFTMADILVYLDAHPRLKTANTEHRRNEGYQKSLKEDSGG